MKSLFVVVVFLFFKQSYTQYIPLPISDLDSWLRTPSIYVFDCSAAGMIVNAFSEVIGSVLLFVCGCRTAYQFFCPLIRYIFAVCTEVDFYSSFMNGVHPAILDPQGIAFCLLHVKHMRLFLRVMSFQLMCLLLASRHL